MSYERMVEESISLYSYRSGGLWNIGILSRPILDGDSINTLEYDGYGCGIQL